jgi:hypothetical protein
MKQVAELLNQMMAAGVVSRYAIFGAVAQMRYTDAVATIDADVLVALAGSEGVGLLGPIYDFCRERGYFPEGEAIRVGNWPVQFIPIYDSLTREALDEAQTDQVADQPLLVVGPDHLAAIALNTGRAKDFARVLALLESGAATPAGTAGICARHGLLPKWEKFKRRFLDEQDA